MKDILVLLDTSSLCEKRLNAAVQLAQRHKAHLRGLYIEKNADYSLYGGAVVNVVTELFEKQLQDDRKNIASLFETAVTPRHASSSLRIENSYSENGLQAYAGVSDLIVAGQSDPSNVALPVWGHPDRVFMGAGRPTLVVPYIGMPDTLGENIMLAWDQSREAARAIHDAMPLLIAAKKVNLFTAASKRSTRSDVITEAMAEHLARHGVTLEVNSLVLEDIPVAETLLSMSSDLGSDMIVMGGYGHSRLREYALGGTTRTILNSMTVPVVMSH